MDVFIVALLIGIAALLGVLIFRQQGKGPDSNALMLLQNQLQGFTQAVDNKLTGMDGKLADGAGRMFQSIQSLSAALEQKLGEGSAQMFEHIRAQFGESQKLATDIRDTVHRQLTEVAQGVAETRESTKQVFTVAEQLQSLERVLKNQKQRGNLGEAGLELILGNILPPGAFKIQYQFSNGETVDAAIMAKEGLIPIDAKFPLENYLRIIDETDEARRAELERAFKTDLKNRIDETAKYVRPQEGTLPFAFMFIPAEGIYYDLLVNEVGAVKVNTRSLIDYAYNERKVIIVSPTTFAAYLQSVLYGFKAFKVEEAARDIAKNVDNLARHLKAYEDFFKRVGSALSTTVNHYNAATRELGKIDKDVLRITGEKPGFEPMLLERPQTEE